MIRALLMITLAVGIWSYIGAPDRLLWFLESAPVWMGVVILCISHRFYPLSNVAYGWILLGFLLMLVGAHYTYAEVPLFNWLRDEWGMSRNYYDRVGHFFQGVIPAVMLREVCVRNGMLVQNRWFTTALIIGACIGLSALYEIAEMTAAFLVEGATIDSFLGLQGDEWDTQKDMVLAMLGSLVGILGLSGWHDRSIKKLQEKKPHETGIR